MAAETDDTRHWFIFTAGWLALITLAAVIAGIVGFGWDLASYVAKGVRYVFGGAR